MKANFFLFRIFKDDPRNKLERHKVTKEKNTRKCRICGKEISQQDSESYDALCWERWDDQLTEESYNMFDELI
jgi:hypothetical protein